MSADVSINKLKNKHIKHLFRDNGHRLPSETTCRRAALQLSEDKLKQIRNAVHDKQVFLIVDESSLSDTQYLTILVESLETPHVSYFYDNQLLKCAPNSSIIVQAVNDAIRNLGINRKCMIFHQSDQMTCCVKLKLNITGFESYVLFGQSNYGIDPNPVFNQFESI